MMRVLRSDLASREITGMDPQTLWSKQINDEVLILIQRLLSSKLDPTEQEKIVNDICIKLYPLIIHWAKRAGLQTADQEDTAQNVIINLLRYLNPNRGETFGRELASFYPSNYQ